MNAPETSDGGQAALREERRQFKRACISGAVILAAYVAVGLFVWLNDMKLASMRAAGTFSLQEIQGKRLEALVVMDWGSLVIVLGALILVRSLVKWLFSIRRRRKEGPGLPPAALS